MMREAGAMHNRASQLLTDLTVLTGTPTSLAVRNENTPHTLSDECLWGQKAIAAFLGCSLDKVAALRDAGAPIGKAAGHVFSLKSDLVRWLRQQIP